MYSKSAELTRFKPVHCVLIYGQHLVNGKFRRCYEKQKWSTLDDPPKLEINVTIVYGKDDMLRRCARRNVKIRIITEERKVDDVIILDKFCKMGML
ncbi:MAG: hypothetical protein ACP5KD_09330 [Fervidobacterium sp.]